jgi:L-Lysine epsilon oxidase N-terminal/L-lysine epsilon oxidase C-terminal domain
MKAEKTSRIGHTRIHPAIGIARLGNSPNEYFIGPEIPGFYDYPKGGFRDNANRLKRQAARFRILGYDERDRFVAEITEADATIEWTVHLRNTKAVGRIFAGVLHPDEPQRNSKWLKAGNSESQLILDPKAGEVSKLKSTKRLLCREFMRVKFEPILELGRLIYEKDSGRLLVLGGHGHAGTPFPGKRKLKDDGPLDFANHDGWFDDISDGMVVAKVTLKGGRELYVKSAWVIVAPPKFAPELQTVVTLYDTLYQVAIDRGLIPNPFSDPTFWPSFNRDIYPILRRADQMRWVFAKSDVGHDFPVGPGRHNLRTHIFRQFRVPSGHPKEPGTGTGRMPFAWSDLYTEPAISGTLTVTQYNVMQAWAEGNFENDWSGGPPPLSFEISPAGLDRAALEACVGAAFYPGIEASWKMRDVFKYVEPFRLDPQSLSPGDISQQMSLPWQTDFVDCTYEDPYVWWPAQRPINVRENVDDNEKSTENEKPNYVLWDRPFDGQKAQSLTPNDMVTDFYRLGHVLRSGEEFYETNRVGPIPGPKFNDKNFKQRRKKRSRRR